MMTARQMVPDLVNHVTLVVVHLATRPANEVEVVIGMGQLPSRPFVGAQLRFPHKVEIREQG